MRTRQFVWLGAPILGLALVFGFLVADINAQTPAPSAPPAQQAPSQQTPAQPEGTPQPAPGATDRGTAPQGTTPETRAPQAPAQSPNVTIESRSETRSDAPNGTIFGVDATLALVIGAVLLVIIVVSLVAMTKRSDDVVDRRSV